MIFWRRSQVVYSCLAIACIALACTGEESKAQTKKTVEDGPLVAKTTYCSVYRVVDRYGVVIYIAESNGGSYSPVDNSMNACSGLAIVAAKTEK